MSRGAPFLLILVMVGVACGSGLPGGAVSEEGTDDLAYVPYANSAFHCSFERPGDWSVEETANGYPFIVSLTGPKGDNGFYTGIALHIYVQGVIEGPPERQFDNIDDFATDTIIQLRAKQIEEIVETTVAVDGLRGRRVMYSGTLARGLEIGAPLFLVRQDVVVFQKGADIYLFHYMAEDPLYLAYAGAFAHVLDTFRFTD